MKDWFLTLSQREQIMVKFGGAALIIFLVYFMLIDPITSNYSKNKKAVAVAAETLQWMREASQEVKQLRGGNTFSKRPEGKQFVLSIIDKSARKAGLTGVMKRVQPEGESGVRVWFENAAFDELIKWLDVIESKYGLSVNEINIEQTESTGLVNVRVFLDS